MTNQPQPTTDNGNGNGHTPALAHTGQEAPASWTIKYLLDGFDCMLTLRGESGADLLPRTLKALEWLKANNVEPTRPSYPRQEQGPAETKEIRIPLLPDGSPDPGWCATHGVAMKRYEKNGRVWYNHKIAGTDEWCNKKS